MFLYEFDSRLIQHKGLRAKFDHARTKAKAFAIDPDALTRILIIRDYVTHTTAHYEHYLHLLQQAPPPFEWTALQMPAQGGSYTLIEPRLLTLLSNGDESFYIARSAEGDYRHSFAYNNRRAYLTLDGKPTNAPDEAHILFDRVIIIRDVFYYMLAHAPNEFSISPVATRRSFVHGRPVRYASHSTVTISLTHRTTAAHEVRQADRESPRRHLVRRHYRHYKLAPGCGCRTDLNAWEVVELREDWMYRGRCRRCGGTKVAVGPLYRGDASKGFSVAEYHVVG
jgi:hypothetical protein